MHWPWTVLGTGLGKDRCEPCVAVLGAEERVLWYSAQYRDWDLSNGTSPREVRPRRSPARSPELELKTVRPALGPG